MCSDTYLLCLPLFCDPPSHTPPRKIDQVQSAARSPDVHDAFKLEGEMAHAEGGSATEPESDSWTADPDIHLCTWWDRQSPTSCPLLEQSTSVACAQLVLLAQHIFENDEIVTVGDGREASAAFWMTAIEAATGRERPALLRLILVRPHV